jgi:hypothetical protein
MNQKQKKCTLFLKLNSKINYTICPEPVNVEETDTGKSYNFLFDVTKINIIKIKIDDNFENNSAIIVDKITLNGYPIGNLDAVSFLKTKDHKIIRTYGYINQSGEFTIKIRSNIVSLNYINYLLSLTK